MFHFMKLETNTFHLILLLKLATRAIEPSFGLLFGDLLKELHVETLGASIIMSLYDVMMNFSGLFVGPLLKEFSYRKVAIAGSLLCSLGLALTSPASSMAHILATYSVINGKFPPYELISSPHISFKFPPFLFIRSFTEHWINTTSGIIMEIGAHTAHQLCVSECGFLPFRFSSIFSDKDVKNDSFYQF